jgi:diguanylate cyclase (GGDEF)-like protein/PAS domain S-box-containing protein
MKKKIIQTAILSLILFTAMGFVIGNLVHRFLIERYQLEKREMIRELSGFIRARIEANLSNDLLIVHSTAAYISVNPNVTQEEFQEFASKIFRDSTTLKNLAAAPNLVLTYVYPLMGNESIIGVDFRELPEQLPLVNKARESEDLVVAGPIDVLQGGKGLLGRAPVFYNNKGTREFWGIVSSLINFDSLIEELTPILEEYNLSLSVRGIDGSGASGNAFYGSDDLFIEGKAIQSMVMFPNGSWQIAVASNIGWGEDHPYHLFVIFMLAFLVMFATAFTFVRITSLYRIRENENRLDDIIRASSDIIWETDRSGVFTYVSGKGESLLGCAKDDLLGCSIFALLSTEKNSAIITNLRELMEGGKPIVDVEVWLKTRHNKEICVLRNAIPLIDEKTQNPIGYRGVDKDISIRKQLQLKLEENANQLDLFFQQSLDGFFFMMLDKPVEWNDSVDKEAVLDYVFEHQRITKINKAMLHQYRASESDFIGLTPADFYQHDIPGGRKLWRKFFDEGHLHIDTDERRFDGSSAVIEGDYIILTNLQGQITGHFGVQRDVTSERDGEFQLQRYIAINDQNVIISQTDMDGIITYASDAFCRISGYTKEELVGKEHNIVHHPDMTDELFKDLWETITAGKSWHGEIKNLKKDGSFYWVVTDVSPMENRLGECYGYMAVRQDITDKKQLEIVSITDKLTGLYNRQKIDSILEEQRVRLSRYGENYSVIILDIDHFKSVNDTYGHLEGDRILKEVSLLLHKHIRQTDFPGRWGGEEFLILCPHTDINGAAALAEELRKSIEAYDFSIGHSVTVSLGVAQAMAESTKPKSDDSEPDDSEQDFSANINHHKITDQLLRSADAALYKAKESGRNRVVCAG